MRLYFFIYLFLLNSTYAFLQESFLRVNPNGHQGMIRSAVITNDGKYVVTGSFDKSIKKWNLKTGQIEQEFRTHIGVGSEGMIYYLALSPDNKYLAAVGWFGADDESEILGDVRVFDFKSGKMLFVLKGLANTSTGLGFSADSKYLVAGDTDSEIVKWDLSTQKEVARFNYHSKDYGKELSVIATNGNYMVSAGWDAKFCLWDLNKPDKPIKEDKKFFKESLYDDIGALAISKDGEEIAIALNHFIIIYNKSLKPYFVIENKEKPGYLEFSEDGTRLMTGSIKTGGNNHCFIFEKQDKNWIEYCSFDLHQNTVIAGGFIDKNTVVTAGGEHNEIYKWKIKKEGEKPKVLLKMVGNGQEFHSAALNDDYIAYATLWTENFGRSKLTEAFDLFMKTKSKVEDEKEYQKPIIKQNGYELGTYNEGGYSQVNPKLIIKKDGKEIDTISREYWNGSRHNVYTFARNGMIISGGSQGIMTAYDIKGFERNYFIGHEGDIWATSISSDGKRLITSASDQTIRIWSLEKLGKDNPSPDMKSLWDYLIDMEVDDVYHKIIKMINMEDEAKKVNYESWQKVIDALRKKDFPADFLETKLYGYRSQIIYPIVSIFIAKNGEWIIWNEDGYFSASKKGAQLVGYHINKGKDEEAKFYPFGQFDLKYNRPDIILKDLAIADEEMIEFYHQAYLKRLKKFGISEEELSTDIHLPELEITDHAQSGNKLNLSIKAKDSKYNLKRVNIYINDVPVFGSNGKTISAGKNYKENFEIEIPDGNAVVEVSVFNDKGAESLREHVYTLVKKVADKKPNLYLVCIGTSDYADSNFDLKYAAKDAIDLNKTMLYSKMYDKVYQKILTDSTVTLENIRSTKKFLEKASINDVVIVFIAGHGVLDENFDYYYATHDLDFNNPAERGVVYIEIENLLDGIKSIKKLLLMDTCHSGEVDKDDIEKVAETEFEEGDITFRGAGAGIRKKEASGLKVTQELVKELFADVRRGTGATVISSAGGAEYAMESDQWNNGLFTYCLLDALRNKSADLNGDNKLMLSEMQKYLQQRVKELSKGKQVPTSRIENISLDFPLN